MGWASPYIAELQKGSTVKFRPIGNSMQPRIQSGQLCTVVPPSLAPKGLTPGEIALCRVKGSDYLHFIQKVKGAGDDRQFLIGNAKGHLNGWVNLSHIYGVLVSVDP
jgi:hypothetical protein